MLSDTVLIVQKQMVLLYGTTDIATLNFRMKTFTPDRIIYVTDLRQQLHFQQVFSAWRRHVGEGSLPELVHVWFGMLKLQEGAMSSRKET